MADSCFLIGWSRKSDFRIGNLRLFTMLLALFFMLITVTGAAAQEAAPSVKFPAENDEDFGALLNWMTAADAKARDTFIQKASAAVAGSTDPKATAQFAFLHQLAREGLDERAVVLKEYSAIFLDPKTAPDYAATAAYRCAVLLEQDGSIYEANLLLSYVRILDRDGSLWLMREGTWRREPVATATERKFLKHNADHLTYRLIAWVANITPLTGSYRFLFSLLIIFIVIRVLETPIIVRAISGVVSGSERSPTSLHVLSPILWLVLELITVVWFLESAIAWQFIFDLGLTEK